MARLWSCGFELNSTAGIETAGWSGATIQATTVRTGTYATQASTTSGSANRVAYVFQPASANGPFFARTYFRKTANPSAINRIFEFRGVASSMRISIALNTLGQLVLLNTSSVAIGSPSAVLSNNTWYMVELRFDATKSAGAHIAEARLENVVFASSSTQTLTGVGELWWGNNLGANPMTIGPIYYFDDIGINDATSSLQNSYLGQGSIIYVHPSAAGDSNTWQKVAGALGDTSNYNQVNEITPNDATTRLRSNTTGNSDFYAVSSSGIGDNDKVNFVAVGVRYIGAQSSGNRRWRMQIKKAPGGTILKGTDHDSSNTQYLTNKLDSLTATPSNYPLTAYTDPDGVAWTKTTLDTMQIGMEASSVGISNFTYISTVWALIEYVPTIAAAPVNSTNTINFFFS